VSVARPPAVVNAASTVNKSIGLVRRECVDLQDPYCAWDGTHCVNHLDVSGPSKQHFVQSIGGPVQSNACPRGTREKQYRQIKRARGCKKCVFVRFAVKLDDKIAYAASSDGKCYTYTHDRVSGVFRISSRGGNIY